MANKSNHTEELLHSLVLSDDYPKVVIFMQRCLDAIYDEIPPIGQQALTLSKEYMSGKACAEELTQARVMCWEYLDQKDITYNAKNRENNLLRATMGVLHPEKPSDELSDVLEWFVEFLLRAEIPLELINKISGKFIKEYYSKS